VNRGEPEAVGPLIDLLRQLADLVEGLADEEYTQKPVGVVESSIGGHIRHNLDHIQALLRGLPKGFVNYDHRERGTEIERDRGAALTVLQDLEAELNAFAWDTLPSTVTLTGLLAPDRAPVTLATTVERELAFVVSHTIHHNALVRVMVKLLGRALPAEFGYAPSTIANKRSRSCVR
jgi:uncharacterized damage-inducible protein DinB